MNFIVALFTDTSTELMSGAKSREWVHHNSTNQPTNLDLKSCKLSKWRVVGGDLAVLLIKVSAMPRRW